VRAFAKRLGIDRAVFYTLLARAWSVASGLVTIVFVTAHLSPDLQGYYYTFYSLIALQIFAELGLNFAIVQFASHEMANLSWTPEGMVSGSEEAKRRLQSLMHFAFSWFGVAALLTLAVLLPLGMHYFGATTATLARGVNAPWSLLVVASAINLIVNPFMALLEGCGKVAKVAMLRLSQSIASVLSVWVVLSRGGHLYSLAVSSSVTTLVGSAWLWFRYRHFFRDLLAHRTHVPGISWRRELWPFQWRIAVSFTSGYLITQLFNPLLLATHGPAAAGQLGMSLQIISAMNGAAMAWITTKAPTYGQLIATGQIRRLDALFTRGLVQSFAFLFLGVAAVWFTIHYLSMSTSTYATRVLPLPLFSLLCLACLANHIVVAEAVYLRAHKREPFMVLSLLNGLTTAGLGLLLVPRLGATGAVYAYATTSLLIGLGGGTFVFVRHHREWAARAAEIVKPVERHG
jgi:O-antigen/teichoic acid export membrane protein